MGLVAVVQNDIKRVVAYSTLSQLGYMTVALGSSAYSAAIFHLTTHAFFKALLFLGAGSVIIAMHHEQDLRKMGGLRRVMPITYVCMLIGALASIGFPGSSGFFSKDAIIEAAHLAQSPLSSYAHFAVLSCVFVTALYTFRMIFLAFHGAPRWHQHEHAAADKAEHHAHHHGPQESPAVVTVPLVLLAIPSIAAGVLLEPLVFGSYFDGAIVVAANHGAVADMRADYHGLLQFVLHGLSAAPFWLTVAGVATAWVCYIQRPDLPLKLRAAFAWLVWALERKFGFDELYQWAFAGGARKLGTGLWRGGDGAIIDGVLVDGSAGLVGRLAQFTRRIQSGYLYHYAFGMIIGVFVLLTFWFTRP
jgi:NADH-quinone oxidoreductase subunit L